MLAFNRLEIDSPQKLIFGIAPKPVTTRRGLTIGGGCVFPELNLTVPPMQIDDSSFGRVLDMYRDAVREACARALDLGCEGFVVELETLLEMTLNPRYAIQLTEVINEVLDGFHARHGLKTALRITPNDTREMKRPPRMQSGALLERMLETFDGCARAGGELLSIESTGGKEIHDGALLACDITGVVFALGVLGCRDMEFIWSRIADIALEHKTVAAGDTACGFGNTAMVLAEKKMIPRVFAAVVRAVSAVRSLVAYEKGAVGPGKDCGYENIYLKAITGFPMSMEGKVAACAHLSPVGNVAAAACDLWSNESVQNIKLLGGMAPTVCLEQLIYDCRLMNAARARGEDLTLRDLFVASDAKLDPQAYILTPESALRIASAIISQPSHYRASKAAALEAVAILSEGRASGETHVSEMESPYLDMMASAIEALPHKEGEFIDQMLAAADTKNFAPGEYDLAPAQSLAA